jgi:hypothetical protein
MRMRMMIEDDGDVEKGDDGDDNDNAADYDNAVSLVCEDPFLFGAHHLSCPHLLPAVRV